jgi:hypothetical protein
MADQILLVHVTHGRPGRLTLAQLIPLQAIPDSSSPAYCGPGTREVEEHCGYPPSVYFYAGRACPDYGSAALAFPPGCEAGRIDSATPFGTGGVVKQDLSTAFRLAITQDDLDARVAYCRASTVSATTPSGWRQKFAEWLAYYFPSDPQGYWTREAGPERPDPEKLYGSNPNWQAWAWEVRFGTGPSVFEASLWAADSATYQLVLEELGREALSPADAARLATFLSRCRTPGGDANFCTVLEEEVRKRC